MDITPSELNLPKDNFIVEKSPPSVQAEEYRLPASRISEAVLIFNTFSPEDKTYFTQMLLKFLLIKYHSTEPTILSSVSSPTFLEPYFDFLAQAIAPDDKRKPWSEIVQTNTDFHQGPHQQAFAFATELFSSDDQICEVTNKITQAIRIIQGLQTIYENFLFNPQNQNAPISIDLPPTPILDSVSVR